MQETPEKVSKLRTVRKIAFGAFQPDVQLTNNEVHALLRRGALDVWAYPGDLLTELQKSYPVCEFDNQRAPTKVIFKGESCMHFYEDFEAYKAKALAKSSPQPG